MVVKEDEPQVTDTLCISRRNSNTFWSTHFVLEEMVQVEQSEEDRSDVIDYENGFFLLLFESVEEMMQDVNGLESIFIAIT